MQAEADEAAAEARASAEARVAAEVGGEGGGGGCESEDPGSLHDTSKEICRLRQQQRWAKLRAVACT